MKKDNSIAIKEYERIKIYLTEYLESNPNYSKYLESLNGISPYESKIKKMLKELKQEEEYIFFGKILVKIYFYDVESNMKYIRRKLSEIVDNPDYLILIASDEEYEHFVEKIFSKETKAKKLLPTLDEIIEVMNKKLKEASTFEGVGIEKNDILNILNPYSPNETLQIIENLERKIKPFYEKRNGELLETIKSNALFLSKVFGIPKDLKGKLKEGKEKTIPKAGGYKWATNLDRLKLKGF